MKKYVLFFFAIVFVATTITQIATAASITLLAVSVGSASNVTQTSAQLNGSLDTMNAPKGVGTANVGFIYFATSLPDTQTKVSAGSLTQAGPFSATVTGLTCNTAYQFTAIATANFTDFVARSGKPSSFTTAACVKTPPVLSILQPTNITSNSATLNFSIDSMGNQPSINLGFYFYPPASVVSTPPSLTMIPGSITQTGPVSYQATNLVCGVPYSIKPWMNNPFTLGRTQITQLIVPCSPSAVTTVAATNVTGSGATLNGNITSLGKDTTVAAGFDTSIGRINVGQATTPGTFSANVGNLNCGTSYSYVATTDGAARTNGQKLVFTTSSCATIVTPISATNITATSATLNASLTSLGSAKTATVGFSFSNNSKQQDVGAMTTPGQFSLNVTNLTCGTQYAFKTYATTNSGTQQGTTGLTFTTLPCSASFGNVPVGLTSQSPINSTGVNSVSPAANAVASTSTSITVKLNPIVDPNASCNSGQSTGIGSVSIIDQTTAGCQQSQGGGAGQDGGKVVPTLGASALDAFDTPTVSQLQFVPSVDNQLSMGSDVNNSDTNTQTVPKYAFAKKLSYGSTGSDVAQLQKVLSADGYLTGVTLGNFYGLATTKAVKQFQKANGIAQTGVVGPLTQAALNK